MNSFQWSLDDLTINAESSPENRRTLSRAEVLVLGWLVHNPTGRTYANMARDCKLTLEQCKKAVRGLMDLDILRLH